MKKRVFLIHGWEGKPHNHWFPWLSLELRANGFDVSAPQMPNAATPNVAEWLSFLKGYVGTPDSHTYFVGHSLGCIAIARYLEALPQKIKIGGALFVAGFSGRINVPEISEFYSLPFDPSRAKTHSKSFVMIFSDNDPYVPMARSLEFAKQLGAKTILERGKRHFTAREGVTALPSVLPSLLKMSS
ncbi:MAG: hypothetical protein A2849_00700 [Candidatus Taylorbacteria bacterium RIFCSPHIGHO2_01_FULL_51_15]|uniref:Alpha/beta hydrolase n=1 Tax=Candidatus Taylorbacteria bacterium RIFCSPHIGHO2_01_FULL_51_15 TaxID=1802304 RepID=A0A1G2M9C4_9BACT|nr:MAG: hypothetical protein A2849_00700 [Candidatus Taylorbacteria bacterium RIFCSPHIGHO2_01_FULL_51_15]